MELKMNEKVILSNDDIFDKGGLRKVFVHPEDSSKIIKVSSFDDNGQNELEASYYNHLRTQKISYKHISKYFGEIETNLGHGVVFEKITNYDNTKCLDLEQFIKQKIVSRSYLDELITELRDNILSNNILFYDVGLSNILSQEYEKNRYKLVIIDGLGGRYKENLNFHLRLKYKFLSIRKIKEQWDKFEKVFKNEADIVYDNIFLWDKYSDQPNIIKNGEFKKRVRKLHLNDFIKMIFTTIYVLPFSILFMKFFKGKIEVSNKDFIGLGVNLDKDDGKNTQQDLIEELGVKNLIIRVPLEDIENIEMYVDFAKSFNQKSKKNILINIIQNRENLQNHALLRRNLENIFENFKNISDEYQVGTTINRLKWEIFSIKEDYIPMFEIAQSLKEQKYSNIKLLGPSVIDFEYYYNARAMFNLKKIKYDITSALLYVDRRGSPKNRQYGFFDLRNKIDLLYSLVRLSPKTLSDKIYITETNYPISNTAPYAPTSEKECVSLENYTKYMLEYFEIAKKSKKIRRVYWHQLIATGYGLVANRDGKIVKYPQYYAFKEMLKNK
ncbi:hypothetical protein CRU89_01600 [Aliarcobacter trophiarum]|nr:hypothetical protein CRU89_01600 [Aliarcobacter trophiarum]